ncbi:MAG: nucleoside-diphosphate sugar epimerase [Gammaproteobacteria bacterium]|nr:nucleoside-diphosphate sugar epimerase [Gammaproteobacteria bacterium]
MSASDSAPLIVWRLIDGKRGHETQTLGLVGSLRRSRRLVCHDIRVSGTKTGYWRWLRGRFPEGRSLSSPDLLLGAGHTTHGYLLAARRARGGRAVVLMTPSLPYRLFDLCLVPEHDGPPVRENLISTVGALNDITAKGIHDAARSLILIGGPSRHFQWNSKAILQQLQMLFGTESDRQFTLTTSRRTPADFLETLEQLHPHNCQLVPLSSTGKGWVSQQLSCCHHAWVTEDSVSMIYESLTAGCSVGLLKVPARGKGRIVKGVEQLVRRGWVTTFDDWQRTGRLVSPEVGFNEADRCGEIILDRWFPSVS